MGYDLRTTKDQYKPTPDKGNYLTGIYIGIVQSSKDDAQKMGRLRVWIPEFGGSETDEKNHYIASYASPFGGATDVRKNEASSTGKSQQSYGMWMVPPDRGNEVLVCFVNGDPNRAYWFGCVWQQNMNHMVPAIGVGPTPDGLQPCVEYNKKDPENKTVIDSGPDAVVRPAFEPLRDGLDTQGLLADERYGIATTSARRESPSRAFGFVTPRGHTIHIDDGELENPSAEEAEDNQPIHEFIRLRTRSGIGITISETHGSIFMVSRNGNYLEVSDDGVSLYTDSPLSLRTTADYNIQSGGDINLDAGGSINMYASDKVVIGAAGDTHLSAGGDLLMGSEGSASISAGGDFLVSAGGVIGVGARGSLILKGSPIIQGMEPPAAPYPLVPRRSDFPDGDGGSGTGQSIGSSMPHRQSYDASINGGDEDIAAGTIPTNAEKKRLWQVMYAEMRRLGWSDTGAKAMIAEIGRENDYNSRYMFGLHRDAANRQVNVGMISWQGDRGRKLIAHLKRDGVLNPDGSVMQTDAAIRSQIRFMDKEMRSSYSPSYTAVRSTTRSYRSIEYTLSTNYIRWDRAGNSINSSRHLSKMDRYYNAINSGIPRKA